MTQHLIQLSYMCSMEVMVDMMAIGLLYGLELGCNDAQAGLATLTTQEKETVAGLPSLLHWR